MIRTTKAQRRAIRRVYERHTVHAQPAGTPARMIGGRPTTYREYRKLLQPSLDGSGCVMLPFVGIWLGIETNGYTHS